jgi:hypothetical protein
VYCLKEQGAFKANSSRRSSCQTLIAASACTGQLLLEQRALTTQETVPSGAFLNVLVALHCHSAQPCRLVASARHSALLCSQNIVRRHGMPNTSQHSTREHWDNAQQSLLWFGKPCLW